MKKIICMLLVMAGFSAFALNPMCRGLQQKKTTKQMKAKKHKHSPTPLADLVLFPGSIS